MTDFHESKTVSVRKQHVCECCGCFIEPGERAVRQAGVWEGDFYHRVMHPVCWEIWWQDASDDGELNNWRDSLYYWLCRNLGDDEGTECFQASVHFARESRRAA